MFNQLKMMQKMLQDKNLRAFMMHPKVQALVADPAFTEAMQAKDTEKIKDHPKMKELAQDPELKELLTKVDFSSFA